MDYKKSHRILWICLIGALALSIINCVLAYINESAAIVGIAVAVIVAAAGIIQAIRFFRCPYCGCNLYLWGRGECLNTARTAENGWYCAKRLKWAE